MEYLVLVLRLLVLLLLVQAMESMQKSSYNSDVLVVHLQAVECLVPRVGLHESEAGCV